MPYSLRIRNEVLNQVRQGKTLTEVSQMYGISRQAIGQWLKSSNNNPNGTPSVRKHHDIEEIIEVIRLAETENLSASQIADLKKLKRSTVRDWIKDKSRLLAVYSSQGQRLRNAGMAQCPGEEISAMSKPVDKDTRQHIRDLKDENEFLKAKVAYLEALMELNGTPVSSFKKKRNIRPSTKSSEEKSET